MASDWQPPEGPARHALQGALAIAVAGALIVLLGLFGTAASVAAVVMIVIGTVLSAPRAPLGDWWGLLVLGAGLSVAAAVIQLGSETVGGLLAVLGGVLVLIGASLGFPLRRV